MNTFKNIPALLTVEPNFVGWKWEEVDGRLTKPPYQITHPTRKASTKDPATWASFQQASNIIADPLTSLDGIGFVLPVGRVGIDFDGVVTDGFIEPYSKEILKLLHDPYIEFSPSEDGVHTFVDCSKLPSKACKFKGKKSGVDKFEMEIYLGGQTNRYLTLTGNKVPGSGTTIPTLSPAEMELPYYLISQFGNERFKKLWMGDSSDYENDASSGDMALVNTLAKRFTDDPQKVDAAFRMSKRMRPKWDEIHNGKDTYGEMTIAKVFSGRAQNPFTESGTSRIDKSPRKKPEIISVLASEVRPVPIEFLWEPYLQQDALNAVYGNPGVGKGNVSIDAVARLSMGRLFPTETTTDRKPMKCVILAAEECAENTLVPRLMAAGADLKMVRIIKSVRIHDKDDQMSDRLMTFQTDMSLLKEDLLAHPDEHFILIDPITNYIGEANFNQDGEVRPVLTMLGQLAEELKITIVIIGHFNKNVHVGSALDKPGGARAWVAVPRACWGVYKAPDNKKQRAMLNLKMNNAEESETGLMFTIESRIIGPKSNGKPWSVSSVSWGDKTDMTADDMAASEQPEGKNASKGVTFLNEFLEDRAQRATDVYKQAERKDINERTIKRACVDIGIIKFKTPEDGWMWQHPRDSKPIPDSATHLNHEAQQRRGEQKYQPMSEPEICTPETAHRG